MKLRHIVLGPMLASTLMGCSLLFQQSEDVGASVDSGTTDGSFDEGGLIGWWRFDEGAGTVVADSSGNSNNGLLSNGDALNGVGPRFVPGRIGNGVGLDGVDDAIEILDPATFVPTGDYTFALWELVRESHDNQTLIYQRGTSGPSFHLKHVGVEPEGSFQVLHNDELVINVFNLPGLAGTWMHVAVTRENGAVTLYVDGLPVAEGNATAPISFDGDCALLIGQVGCTATAAQPAGAILDELRLYDRALPPAEVAALAGR